MINSRETLKHESVVKSGLLLTENSCNFAMHTWTGTGLALHVGGILCGRIEHMFDSMHQGSGILIGRATQVLLIYIYSMIDWTGLLVS